jgi:hypothetical protein
MSNPLGNKVGKIDTSSLLQGQSENSLSKKPRKSSPSSLDAPSKGSTDVQIIKRQIYESDILGEIGTSFHEEDYTRLKDYYKKNEEEFKKIPDHIEKELARMEKKLKKLFKIQEKLTGKTSKDKFDAIKDGLESKKDSVICYGGEFDSDLSGGTTASGELNKIVASAPSLEDNEGLLLSGVAFKEKYSFITGRVKSITYKVLSLISRYQNLKIVKKKLEDSSGFHGHGKDFLDDAVNDKKTFDTIGPIENPNLTGTS